MIILQNNRVQLLYVTAFVVVFVISIFDSLSATSSVSPFSALGSFFFTPPYQKFVTAPLLGFLVVELVRMYTAPLAIIRASRTKLFVSYLKTYLLLTSLLFLIITAAILLCNMIFIIAVSQKEPVNILAYLGSPVTNCYLVLRILLVIAWFTVYALAFSLVALRNIPRIAILTIPLLIILPLIALYEIVQHGRRLRWMIEILDFGTANPFSGALFLLWVILLICCLCFGNFEFYNIRHDKLGKAVVICLLVLALYCLYSLLFLPPDGRYLEEIFWGFANPPDILITCPLLVFSVLVASLWIFNDRKRFLGALEFYCVLRGSLQARVFTTYFIRADIKLIWLTFNTVFPFIFALDSISYIDVLQLFLLSFGFTLLALFISAFAILGEFLFARGVEVLVLIAVTVTLFGVLPIPSEYKWLVGFFPSFGTSAQVISCVSLTIIATIGVVLCYKTISHYIVSSNANKE